MQHEPRPGGTKSPKSCSRQSVTKNLLISAINNENFQEIQKYIEQGADVNENWPFGDHSIFTKAVEKGNVDIIRYLIRNGAKVNNKDIKITALVAAIKNNASLAVVQVLVENGADIYESDSFGRTPLNEAVALKKIDVVKYLLDQGADVNQSNGSGACPLALAVSNNSFEAVELLVSRGANIYKPDSEGATALTLAQRLNDSRILQYLEGRSRGLSVYHPLRRVWYQEEQETKRQFYNSLSEVQLLLAEEALEKQADSKNCALTSTESEKESERKSFRNNAKYEEEAEDVSLLQNVNDPDHEGVTPLAKAIQFERPEIVELLLTSGAQACKMVKGKPPLLLATEKENLEIIRLLLEHGAEHTIQTAFFEAITLSNLEIVKLLIQKGAILNLIYLNGYTPLIKSIETQNFNVVKELVENGANVNMPGRDGKLPLSKCLESGNSDIVTYIFNKGATMTEKCPYLQKYIESGNVKMVKTLLELLKVDTDSVFDCGCTPLTKAAELENLEMVKCVFRSDSVDGNGKTALAVAARKQNLPIVKFLLDSGADSGLANREIEEFAKVSEDFALYLELAKGEYTQWT